MENQTQTTTPPPTAESIDDITRRYTDRILYTSKKEKYQSTWETSPMTQGIEIIRTELTYPIARLALYTMMVNKLESEGKRFYMPRESKPADRLKQILLSITGDITGRYNPTKGIFLFGEPSTGKTFIMQAIYHMMLRAYYTGWYHLDKPYWFSYKELMLRARKEGSIAFIDQIFKGKDIIFFDDLGYADDNQLNLYGTKENVIIHLVETLYRQYQSTGTRVYFTSNLQLTEIESQMGRHTADRIHDMCTPVTWVSDINFRRL